MEHNLSRLPNRMFIPTWQKAENQIFPKRWGGGKVSLAVISLRVCLEKAKQSREGKGKQKQLTFDKFFHVFQSCSQRF